MPATKRLRCVDLEISAPDTDRGPPQPSPLLARGSLAEEGRLGRSYRSGPSIINPSMALLFCRFAGRIPGITGSFLLDLQQNRPFGALGGNESLCLLGFALSLRGKFGGTRGLFGQFGLTRPLGGFALGDADQTCLVHGHPGSVPPGGFRVFG